MTPEGFQARVEFVVGMLERLHDRQYPLRSIPMDLVADAVARDAQAAGRELAALTPYEIAAGLNAVLARNLILPGSALHFHSTPDQFDVVSPWQASSYAAHDGVERLRDGG